jgi:hypothetical protein
MRLEDGGLAGRKKLVLNLRRGGFALNSRARKVPEVADGAART